MSKHGSHREEWAQTCCAAKHPMIAACVGRALLVLAAANAPSTRDVGNPPAPVRGAVDDRDTFNF